MKRVIEVIGSSMISRGTKEIQNDLWGSGGSVKLRLTEVLRMSKMWMEKVGKVVKMWGGRFEDDSTVKEFVNRMEEVVSLRS